MLLAFLSVGVLSQWFYTAFREKISAQVSHCGHDEALGTDTDIPV